ncbi:conserved hypothetical protein [Nitrobacter hamburgensis X14]|uniref:DUF1993 domain-containing protein n=2 Tax=Nitrobacter hamburgensis TaxID=912 RepID=Q1QPA8_NITHX|nr:conserved hypothetical protein [Nitrobacter hamburgensis X14]
MRRGSPCADGGALCCISSSPRIIEQKEHPMSFYDSAAPAFLQTLGALSDILSKAEAHAVARKIAPETLLTARLYPDMLPLTRQIQIACDFAVKTCARLSGSEVPSTPDTEKTFDELQQRLAKATDYVKDAAPAKFEGAENRDVTFPAGPDKTMTLKGQQYLSHFALPNFYFHATTAYDILRHNGLEIGKRDFMGVK